MDDAAFLKAARAQIEASGRLDLPASLTPADALRLLEMAERAGPRRQAAPVPGEGDVWAEVIAELEQQSRTPARVLCGRKFGILVDLIGEVLRGPEDRAMEARLAAAQTDRG